MEQFYVGVGLKVRAYRTAQKMKQEELAKGIVPPVTRAAIANLEGGKQRVRAHTLWELARVLGVSPMDLVPGAEEERRRVSTQRAVEAELGKAIPELSPALVAEISKRATNSVTTRVRRAKERR